jgi:hypothetical protein
MNGVNLMTIKRYIDDYGFDCLEVFASGGGHKNITFHGGFTDIASVTSSNGVGLGSSDYIRNVDDVQRHLNGVNQTVWLDEKEKEVIIAFLHEITTKTLAFLKVKDRFHVKKSYTDGKGVYTFTEKPDAVITLHAEISITIAIPSGWDESNAWRALLDVLNPTSISSEERFGLKQK